MSISDNLNKMKSLISSIKANNHVLHDIKIKLGHEEESEKIKEDSNAKAEAPPSSIEGVGRCQGAELEVIINEQASSIKQIMAVIGDGFAKPSE